MAIPATQRSVTKKCRSQLARSLKPGDTVDPLAYRWDVDTELRSLFDVPEPPDTWAPPAAPTKSWLDFFIGRAYAGDSAAQALDRWIPTRDESSRMPPASG